MLKDPPARSREHFEIDEEVRIDLPNGLAFIRVEAGFASEQLPIPLQRVLVFGDGETGEQVDHGRDVTPVPTSSQDECYLALALSDCCEQYLAL